MGIGPYKYPRKINGFRGRTESSAPTKEYEKPRGSGEKSPRFPFHAGAGRCGHRPLQPTSQSAGFRGRTESSAPTKGIKNKARPAEIAASPVLRRRGRCPHRPIPPPKRKHPCGGGRALLYRVSISHRRGGRPCPPAGNACFYGNPMRIRNILTGRCGHRPLQTASEKRNILPFRVVGVDAHIDPQEMAGLLRFSGEIVLFFYSTP